ncbi:MAG TPA: phage tail protein [Crenotrichaceae bacterium]|nr:phage tail protein [Crenotrichaceae bacterium]
MSEPFIAEIIMFGGNFAPRSWGFCSGQLLAISQNTALFSLLGTTYGGDGRTTFSLPDLRGRVPVHSGQGPGLSSYRPGQRGGVENVTLSVLQMPAHTHAATVDLKARLNAEKGPANSNNPAGNMIASHAGGNAFKPYNPNIDKLMADQSITDNGTTVTNANAGGGQPHTNLQPYTVVNFIIALQGIFPSRS